MRKVSPLASRPAGCKCRRVGGSRSLGCQGRADAGRGALAHFAVDARRGSEFRPNQRMKLTGAAILVSRGMEVLQAAPAAYPYRSAAGSSLALGRSAQNITLLRRYDDAFHVPDLGTVRGAAHSAKI